MLRQYRTTVAGRRKDGESKEIKEWLGI